ncbi:MAG: hypothetical protein KBC83_02150 [Candidatus Moranbacteria bacterium]|nr:hypothetical protein [Candidatus Moranbacteria bacterium]
MLFYYFRKFTAIVLPPTKQEESFEETVMNLSQVRDQRFWVRWHDAGALGTMLSAIEQSILAVVHTEVTEFGCPYCGFRSGSSTIQAGGAAMWSCGECSKTSVILAEGKHRSTIGLGTKYGIAYPKLRVHPRRGIPAHGTADRRPDGGGEYFRSRGIGMETTPGCFVCGGERALYHNIAAFVQTKEAGERVVGMFAHGARLDYRSHEPDRVQVKIGACHGHLANLECLDRLVEGGVITTEIILSTITALKIKKAVLWWLVTGVVPPVLTTEDQKIESLMPLVSALFPGVSYFSHTGFSQVMHTCVIPVLKKRYPEFQCGPVGRVVQSDEEVEFEPFLPSRGYEWQNSGEWKKRFAELLAA